MIMTDTSDVPEGMQEVRCALCDTPLGWQEADVPVDPAVWLHSRCPERQARVWGMTRVEVEALTQHVAVSLAESFPDLPQSVRALRTRIAAEHVLENLSRDYLIRET